MKKPYQIEARGPSSSSMQWPPSAAYALEDYAAAKHALDSLHCERMDLNPSAASSLPEGMEETLTMHRLHLPSQLRKTMASTNVIEPAFSIEQVCRNVKRCHGGNQRERWVGSGPLVAEKQFRRIIGHEQNPPHSRIRIYEAAESRGCEENKGRRRVEPA